MLPQFISESEHRVESESSKPSRSQNGSAEERRKAGLLNLHGVDMTDIAKVVEIGKKLAEYRAGIVAKAFEASKAKLR